MPQGKGTYGSKVGRPPKKSTSVIKPGKSHYEQLKAKYGGKHQTTNREGKKITYNPSMGGKTQAERSEEINLGGHNPYKTSPTGSPKITSTTEKAEVVKGLQNWKPGSAVPLLGKAVMAVGGLGGMPYAGTLKKEEVTQPVDKSAAPFKMRSGNVTPFKLMGSSPLPLWGGFKQALQIGKKLVGGGMKKDVQALADKSQGSPAEPTAPAVPPHGDEAHTGGGSDSAETLMEANVVDPTTVDKTKSFAFGSNAATANPAVANPASLGMFSDIRLKEKIKRTGASPSGIPIYEFNYINSNNRYSGAMAQDLLDINPSAVSLDSSGYYKVNYDDIDVDMHLIN